MTAQPPKQLPTGFLQDMSYYSVLLMQKHVMRETISSPNKNNLWYSALLSSAFLFIKI